ncbi:FecR family protein [Flavobacterium rhamnosiphilum]|uniref:FecR family protein n=1 Tax=Flavobacterium rhamnosiphilum TaxID=2541724 RepID=A0A4R5F6I9_9FLAO|nr:FecR family protein [Flavobacterium rhamnosiphilum]
MTVKKSELLIVKFITNHASQGEIEILSQWLEDLENQKAFKDFVKINYAIDYTMNSFDSVETKKQLLQKINQDKSIFYRRRLQSYFKYAALAVLFIGLVFVFKNGSFFEQEKGVLIPKEGVITLKLADGSLQIINPSNSKNITDKFGKVMGKQDKSRISYSDANASGSLVYNTLKIPYGKRFELELSDGTIVHLNSGTSLTYPIRFLKNQNRQVLLTGEAFFEVAKDKKHPFTVNAQELNVEVLGTTFNVSSYTDDPVIDVVLVEGKVGLYKEVKTRDGMVKLTAGLKGSNIKGRETITTESVNTRAYTAWVQGNLVFKNVSFDAIIKKLERHYNVAFINKNKTLGKEIFNASFKGESIEEVLAYFSDSYAIDYTIKDNKIIIK